MGAKALEGSKLNTQVAQLKALLVQKEKRLQTALGDAEAALQEEESSAQRAQQPQEPPIPPRGERAPSRTPKEANEQHLLQLAKTTEELTDALEVARQAEGEAMRRATKTATKLLREQAQRTKFEEELSAIRDQHKVEVASLHAHIQQQAEALVLELNRAAELEKY